MGSSTLWTQIAGTGDEHTNSPPTEHLGNLLNAVWIRRDNNDGVLHATKLESKIYIGGQSRAHFFKSVHKSAKCASGRINAHFF